MEYRFLTEIGRGAMGVVYRARHEKLDRDVAIKVMGDAGLDDGSGPDRLRFLREIRVLKEIRHPNIVRVLDAGEDQGRVYLVMELLEAQDLSTVRSDGMPVDRVVSILDQLLDAVDHLHSRGLLHRDIKAENVMVCSDGRAVLMDFGLARTAESTMLTEAGAIVGTPRYFAPEVVMGRDPTTLSDLWSLGVLAYLLLTGRRPFDAPSLAELIVRIGKTEPPPPHVVRPQVPEAVSAVVMRFLAKEPKDRWPDASTARGALAEAVVGAPRRKTRKAPPARPPEPRARARSPYAVAAAGGVAGILVTTLVLSWPAPTPAPTKAPAKVEVTPEAAIAALGAELDRAGLTQRAIDAVWEAVLPRARRLNPDQRHERMPEIVAQHPDVAAPFRELASRVLDPGTRAGIEAVRPWAGRMLLGPAGSESDRSRLLDLLWRLELLDALANQLGLEPPVGARGMMAPAVEVSSVRAEMPPGAGPATAVFPPPGGRGTLVYRPHEVPDAGATTVLGFGDALIEQRELQDRDASAGIRFADPVEPAGAKQIHFQLSFMPRQYYAMLRPPGAPWTIRLRAPDGYEPETHTFSTERKQPLWISLTLRGAMAPGRGTWSVTQGRSLSMPLYKPMFAVDRVLVQPVDFREGRGR